MHSVAVCFTCIKMGLCVVVWWSSILIFYINNGAAFTIQAALTVHIQSDLLGRSHHLTSQLSLVVDTATMSLNTLYSIKPFNLYIHFGSSVFLTSLPASNNCLHWEPCFCHIVLHRLTGVTCTGSHTIGGGVECTLNAMSHPNMLFFFF